MANGMYVPRHPEMVYQQPFDADKVKFYGFMLAADGQALQNICDKYLNHPSGGQVDFRPLAPMVMLVFCSLGKLQSSNPPDHDKGWFSENEAAFWLLTINTKNGDLRWFHPYMMVDNAHAFAMGRELYGFPKSMGQCIIPDDPQSATKFSARTHVFKKFTPNTAESEEEVIAVKRLKKNTPLRKSAMHHSFFHTVRQFAWEYLKDRLHSDTLLHKVGVKEIMHSLVSIPMIFLKQFRDVEDASKACYQSLVEVDAQLKFNPLPRGGLLYGDYTVTINSFASHPFQSDFGFTASKLDPLTCFWCLFNFHMGNGKEIWRAS